MVSKIKSSINKSLIHRSELASRAVMIVAALIMLVSPLPLVALDKQYDNQIDATQQEIKTYKNEQVRLGDYAESLSEAIADLEAQLRDVNMQISLNEQQFDALSAEVVRSDKEVQEKSRQLGLVLRDAYIDSGVSPLEIVASSKSVSEFMDYYEARDRLQSELLKSLNVLKAAKRVVAAQREEVHKVLRDGKAMRDTLEKKVTEQNELLEQARGQQELYRAFVDERNANIKRLREEQLGANKSFFARGKLLEGDPKKGGYPERLDRASQDSVVDPWGMYNRECVSYTAWKVYQSGRRMPYWGGRGNANEWPSSAEADGIETGSTPKKGAVAIAFIGPYGHAMYVEEVLKNGDIRISEYNYFVDGTYTERITSAAGLTYIYFEK